jgi:hypothetical protein
MELDCELRRFGEEKGGHPILKIMSRPLRIVTCALFISSSRLPRERIDQTSKVVRSEVTASFFGWDKRQKRSDINPTTMKRKGEEVGAEGSRWRGD